jgi:3-oxoacyl-[acyl-carrier-protein] synthase-3
MIFGDGAAALLVGVAHDGEQSDFDYLQTSASGPATGSTGAPGPDPALDDNITVAGPLVEEMAGRRLARMLAELAALPNPSGRAGSLLESVDLVVPHQANKTMVGSPRQAMPVR